MVVSAVVNSILVGPKSVVACLGTKSILLLESSQGKFRPDGVGIAKNAELGRVSTEGKALRYARR